MSGVGDGPDGTGLGGLDTWPLGPFDGITADEFAHDNGITEGLPEHRVQMSNGRYGERPTVAASVHQEVAVELGKR